MGSDRQCVPDIKCVSTIVTIRSCKTKIQILRQHIQFPVGLKEFVSSDILKGGGGYNR
mgnify:CR=1 FL=1